MVSRVRAADHLGGVEWYLLQLVEAGPIQDRLAVCADLHARHRRLVEDDVACFIRVTRLRGRSVATEVALVLRLQPLRLLTVTAAAMCGAVYRQKGPPSAGR